MKTSFTKRIAELANLVMEKHGETFLDEAVHDSVSIQASAINNDGLEAQIEYLGADFVEELLKGEH